jgi:hypothetical protein
MISKTNQLNERMCLFSSKCILANMALPTPSHSGKSALPLIWLVYFTRTRVLRSYCPWYAHFTILAPCDVYFTILALTICISQFQPLPSVFHSFSPLLCLFYNFSPHHLYFTISALAICISQFQPLAMFILQFWPLPSVFNNFTIMAFKKNDLQRKFRATPEENHSTRDICTQTTKHEHIKTKVMANETIIHGVNILMNTFHMLHQVSTVRETSPT